MDTTEHAKRKKVRAHPAELRAQVLVECAQPGASVAKMALRHGLNANLVHKWQREGDGGTAGVQNGDAEFIALPLAPPVPAAIAPLAADIRLELRPRGDLDQHQLAGGGGRRVRRLAGAVAAMIRIDAVWLAVYPVDLRSGAERLLAQVVQVFGAARSHHGYLFANAG